MTKAFDDKAKRKMIEIFNEDDFKYNGVPVRDMNLIQVDAKFARPYIATFHYSGSLPDSSKYIYAGYLGNKLCGVIVYGMGAGKNQYTSIIPEIQNGQYVELTRLWCANDMPKNTESKIVSESLKKLPPEIKLVISFADSSKGHSGTIYQATNWHYLGINNGGKVLITEDGTEQHTRLLGIYKTRHPELKKKTNDEIMEMYGWTYGAAGKKNRYVYFLGDKKTKKTMYKQIKERILPYPKYDKKLNLKSEMEIIKELSMKRNSEQLCML